MTSRRSRRRPVVRRTMTSRRSRRRPVVRQTKTRRRRRRSVLLRQKRKQTIPSLESCPKKPGERGTSIQVERYGLALGEVGTTLLGGNGAPAPRLPRPPKPAPSAVSSNVSRAQEGSRRRHTLPRRGKSLPREGRRSKTKSCCFCSGSLSSGSKSTFRRAEKRKNEDFAFPVIYLALSCFGRPMVGPDGTEQ